MPGTRWHSPFPTAKGTAQCPHDERAARTPRDRPDVVADVPGRATRPAVVRVRRRRRRTFVVLLLVVTVAFVLRPVPATTGEVEVPGLGAEVEVLRDAHGIPQVYADTDDDLLRAQGYVHAQDRFFEMDVRRHVTVGRLSELFGEDGLETDAVIRTMGWRRVAEQELRGDSTPRPGRRSRRTPTGSTPTSSSHGPAELAVEYTLLAASGLDYEPEPWTPGRLAGLAQGDGVGPARQHERRDRPGAAPASTTRPRRSTQLYPAYPYDRHPPIVGQRRRGRRRLRADRDRRHRAPATRRRRAYSTRRRVDALERVRGRGRRASPTWSAAATGSAPTRGWSTASTPRPATPLLANDPHLGVCMPGIWCRWACTAARSPPTARWTSPASRSPGVPGRDHRPQRRHRLGLHQPRPRRHRPLPRAGRRRRRGATTARRAARRPHRDDRGRAAATTVEVRIRETAPRTADLRRLERVRHGRGQRRRRTSRTPPTPATATASRCAWTALEPGHTADAILALNRATRLGRVPRGRRRLRGPRAEHGVRRPRGPHRLPGARADPDPPVRQRRPVPAEGWGPANDWTGEFVPFDGLPHVLDPEEGFVVTANQAVVGAGLPLLPHRRLGPAATASTRIRDRASRPTRELSRRRDGRDPDRLPQPDGRHPGALPARRRRTCPAATTATGRTCCATGTARQPAGQRAAAAYYNAVWSDLLRLTFHDELRESTAARRRRPLVRRGRARCSRTRPASWWDDATTDDVVETRDDILRQAMEDARDELTSRLARDAGRVDLGRPAPARPAHLDAGRVRHRRRSSGSSTGTTTRSAAARASSTRPRWDASVGYEVDVRRRRCGWWSTWPTSTRPAGSPHRRLGAPGVRPLRRPDRAVGRGRDAPVGLLARRRRGGRRGHADPRPGSRRRLRRRDGPVSVAPRACTPAGVTAACTGRSCGSTGTSSPTSSS